MHSRLAKPLLAALLIVPVMAPGPGRAARAALDNGLARTPPMGWNSWNHFRCNVSEQLIKETSDAIVASGMRDAGYRYVVIDDCWQVARDAAGTLVADSTRFSYGHEEQDARTFAAWGVDYVKEDWCHAEGLDAPTQYAKFRDALAKAGRPIVFSICEWGSNEPWEWAPQIGNLWRTTGDIRDRWSSMLSLLDLSSQHASVARPGAWNDPDMLEVGNGGMTDDEYRAHFSLWAIMAAPLMAGNDVRAMSAATRDILTNPDVIAVDQDSLGVQGMLVREGPPELQVWAKPLKGGARALALLNRGDSAAKITARFDRLGLRTDSATVRDLWARADRGAFRREYAATVPAHGVALVRVTPIRAK